VPLRLKWLVAVGVAQSVAAVASAEDCVTITITVTEIRQFIQA
jgi:hypothetical protein